MVHGLSNGHLSCFHFVFLPECISAQSCQVAISNCPSMPCQSHLSLLHHTHTHTHIHAHTYKVNSPIYPMEITSAFTRIHARKKNDRFDHFKIELLYFFWSHTLSSEPEQKKIVYFYHSCKVETVYLPSSVWWQNILCTTGQI